MRETSDSNERLGEGGYDSVGRDRRHAQGRADGNRQNALANKSADGAVVVVGIAGAADDLGVMIAIGCVFMLVRGVGCMSNVRVCAAITGIMVARRMIVQPTAEQVAGGVCAD